MRSTLFVGSTLLAASIVFAACSSGGTQAMLGGARGGDVQPAQSCKYAECITLSYGSPFEQQWCINLRGLGFFSSEITGGCPSTGGRAPYA